MSNLPSDRDAARAAIDEFLQSMGRGIDLPPALLPNQAERIE
jgi:hypothetical protein